MPPTFADAPPSSAWAEADWVRAAKAAPPRWVAFRPLLRRAPADAARVMRADKTPLPYTPSARAPHLALRALLAGLARTSGTPKIAGNHSAADRCWSPI